MIRKLVLLLLILGVALPLASCGRKGPLEAPPGTEYPRKYPAE